MKPLSAVLLLLPCLLAAPALHAQQAATSRTPKKPVEHAACIEVQVDGERTPAWDCLQRRLAPASTPTRQPTLTEAERLMRQPGNQMLQYNLEGTRQRMGNAFGHSVVPQRPAR
ncbi:hypothetical protein [Stenotrophomonas sp. 24(2023)]|uniref:hypothetical protein n=1 Tax=Stenotrophomonas sp. 24(2023) TaxID=3068324 RepID=UPI0027E12C78|nr:hypothetical protein [Stenotrophomonas sp. 24(2023)]WMJ71534.1 hypothetical protein Q9R17_19805 [Stenotrophomonas sp. 24(2023)]